MTRRRRIEEERVQAVRQVDETLRKIREEAGPQLVSALERLLDEIEGDPHGG